MRRRKLSCTPAQSCGSLRPAGVAQGTLGAHMILGNDIDAFAPRSRRPERRSGRKLMSGKIYPVPPAWRQRAFIDSAKYEELYAWSVEDPEAFWADQARRIEWIRPFSRVKNTSFGPGDVSIRWFEDGTTNAAYNCIDRHLPRLGSHTAIIWEGDDPRDSRHITYQELHDQVCRLANVLKDYGVEKGDTVTIYLPMIPQAVYAMLACARIGAIHSVVFAGFSPDSLAGRIRDCRSRVLITADGGRRGGRTTPPPRPGKSRPCSFSATRALRSLGTRIATSGGTRRSPRRAQNAPMPR